MNIKSMGSKIVFPRLTLNLAAVIFLFLGFWVLTGGLNRVQFLFEVLPSILFVKQNSVLGLFLCSVGLLAGAMSGYLNWTIKTAEERVLELDKERVQSFSVKERVIAEHQKNIQIQEMLFKQTQELTRANANLKTANERLHELAHQDALTNFLNRRGLQEVLTRELARAKRQGESLVRGPAQFG